MQTLIKSKLVCNTIKVYFKARNINRDIKEGHFIKIKVSLPQGDIFIHLYLIAQSQNIQSTNLQLYRKKIFHNHSGKT